MKIILPELMLAVENGSVWNPGAAAPEEDPNALEGPNIEEEDGGGAAAAAADEEGGGAPPVLTGELPVVGQGLVFSWVRLEAPGRESTVVNCLGLK